MNSSPRPVVFGVLNVTPDSFSDGGEHPDRDSAVAHGLALARAGADLVDVGGESTRPGARPVPTGEEARRVLPVVRELAAAGVRVSIDTRHAEVAAAAVEAGATVVNDVSGGTADPRMAATVAATGADYVVMHSRGPAAADGRYGDVVADVIADLRARVEAALTAGLPPERLIVDPGIGFAKTAAENWVLLSRIEEVAAAFPGTRLLVGASRKRFLAPFAAADAPVADRDLATAVLSGLLAARGVWGLRVHDVASTRTAVALEQHMRGAA